MLLKRKSILEIPRNPGQHSEVLDEIVAERCEGNCKEANFFCKNASCQTAICQFCLINVQRSHDVVDIKEERKTLNSNCFGGMQTKDDGRKTRNMQEKQRTARQRKQRLLAEINRLL